MQELTHLVFTKNRDIKLLEMSLRRRLLYIDMFRNFFSESLFQSKFIIKFKMEKTAPTSNSNTA